MWSMEKFTNITDQMIGVTLFFLALILALAGIIIRYVSRKSKEKVPGNIIASKGIHWVEVDRYIFNTFFKFHEDWSTFNIESIKHYVTKDFFSHLQLQLDMLRKQGREDIKSNIRIHDVHLIHTGYEMNDMHKLSVSITAEIDNTLKDERGVIYTNSNILTEYWHFKREKGIWKLDSITLSAAELSKAQEKIASFAHKNHYHFDSSYGVSLLPESGSIFSREIFEFTKVTNHVMGTYNMEPIQIYMYAIHKKIYLVSQVYMKTPFDHIIIRRNTTFKNKPEDVELADIDNWKIAQKYSVYMSLDSSVTELKLLNSQFMKRFESLPKDFTIEIMSNVVFCYTQEFRSTSYEEIQEMTQVLVDELA